MSSAHAMRAASPAADTPFSVDLAEPTNTTRSNTRSINKRMLVRNRLPLKLRQPKPLPELLKRSPLLLRLLRLLLLLLLRLLPRRTLLLASASTSASCSSSVFLYFYSLKAAVSSVPHSSSRLRLYCICTSMAKHRAHPLLTHSLTHAAASSSARYLSTRPPPGPDAPETPVEPQPGIFHEIHDFFVPLVMSLLPTWTPPPRVAPPLPIPTEAERVAPPPDANADANDVAR